MPAVLAWALQVSTVLLETEQQKGENEQKKSE